MPVARFQMPDGRIARFEVPEGTTPEQAQAMIEQSLAGANQKPADQRPPLMRAMQTAAAGAVRGAGSIGATLLAPMDMLNSALLGRPVMSGNNERRAGMDEAFRGMGVDTDSLLYQGSKLGMEVAGTGGVGPALAAGARAVPAVASRAAPLIDAIGTAGMRAGGMSGAGGVGVRTAGGAITGGAAAGAVNPEDAALGAGIGAVIPGGVMLAGAVGGAAARPFRSQEKKAAEALVKALERDPAALAQQLRQARTYVLGASPSVSQALPDSPQASTLERIISESPGGAQLKELYLAQNAARLGALDRVAPVDPRGFRSAQEDFGESALKAIRGGDQAAKNRTRAAYQAVPQTEPAVYLPNLAAVRDEVFPRGAFGGRAAADEAVSVADRIGNVDLPAIKAVRGTDQSLAQAVRKAGGLSLSNNTGLRGELVGLRGELKNLVRTNGGLSPARMAEKMHEAGFIPDEDSATLLTYLRNEAGGDYAGSNFSDGRQFAAARDAAMGGDLPAGRAPVKVTLAEWDALRSSIGSAQRAAKRDPDRAREALALSRMKSSLDDRLNEVVRGDGAIDENLPIDWANKLTEAQALKRQQVEKFRTGPQALAFNTGADNMPSVQGGEFAAKVWGQRPGIASDIKQVRKVIDDHPQVLGQFRSMVTTESAGTATQGGNLTGKFVRWVENSLPGLKATFNDAEVRALQNIAADIKRAEVAASAGAARGSPSYQNASNALSLGLLDSPLMNFAANRVPFVNQVSGPLLEGLREAGRNAKARSMAGLLSDPARAAEAIDGLLNPRFDLLPYQRGLAATAPVLAAQ